MKRLREMTLQDHVAWIVIVFATHGLWVALEQLFYGEVQPRAVDNFIVVVLWVSLYMNYAHWRDKKSGWR